MNLHQDKEAFEELVTAAASELHIPTAIVEKDYYVTLALRELSKRVEDMVFKGGTSLSKCYQVLDRFSEDIDISYAASKGSPGESRKRQLKSAVVASMDALNFPVTNLDETKSRRSYNCYRADYPSMYSPMLTIKNELIIETYVALLPFPTTVRMADNYIHCFLKQTEMEHLTEEYDLMPFPVTTQTMERTLIDKVFAICDYYLTGTTERHSRHLYDIHKIFSAIKLDDSFPALIQEVRHLREPLPMCPSAASTANVTQILTDILNKGVYRDDYKLITESLLFIPVSYEEAISSLQKIIKYKYFG